MELTVREEQGFVIVSLGVEQLDYTVCGVLKSRLLELVKNKAAPVLILDMSQVAFLDSMSIGAFVSISKSLRALKGSFSLCALQPFVAKVLTVVTVSSILPVFDTVEQAMGHFTDMGPADA